MILLHPLVNYNILNQGKSLLDNFNITLQLIEQVFLSFSHFHWYIHELCFLSACTGREKGKEEGQKEGREEGKEGKKEGYCCYCTAPPPSLSTICCKNGLIVQVFTATLWTFSETATIIFLDILEVQL